MMGHEEEVNPDVGSDRERAPARGRSSDLLAQPFGAGRAAHELGGPMTPGMMRWLQRSAGNAAAARMLARSPQQCNPASETDANLAALQARIASNVMSRLDGPDAARREADQRGQNAVGQGGLSWCGFFAELAYLSQGFDRGILPASFDSTLKVYSFFNYLYNAFGTYPMKYIRDDSGEWKQVDRYHAERGSKRCWIPTSALSQEDLDIRPGDIATLAVPRNKQTEKAQGDHVVVVQSYDKTTGHLFTIGGNDSGYVVRNGDLPSQEADADRIKRELMEAATGRSLKKGPRGGHVGVGFQDLRNQHAHGLGQLVTETHVAGIGRPSMVDFEQHEYSNKPAGHPASPAAPKPRPQPSAPSNNGGLPDTAASDHPNGGGNVITIPEVTIVGDVPNMAASDHPNGGGNVITIPEVTIVGDVPTTPTRPRAKPAATPDRPAAQGWVEGQWTDAGFSGEQEIEVDKYTKPELYSQIAKVAPHLSHGLRVCMVGHAWQEQNGTKGVANWNLAGIEGGGTPAWVLAWTSDIIPTSKYENEPDKTKYRDWDSKNHNPKYGVIDGHVAGTIDSQLSLTPKPTRIALLVKKRRPAYQSFSAGAAALVKQIERRVEALRASKAPAQKDLGDKAFAGDADSYAYIVSHSFKITDVNGKQRGFGAYNGDSGYAGRVKAQIAAAASALPTDS